MLRLYSCVALTILVFQATTVSGTSSLFSLVPEGLVDEKRIPFDSQWLEFNEKDKPLPLPKQLEPPSFIRVHEFKSSCNKQSCYAPKNIAREIQTLCDNELVKHGALLFRGLPLSAKEFANMWDEISWPQFKRIDPFYDRYKIDGIDVAPRAWPERIVPVHNEQTYNPKSPEKVLFYMLQEAIEGGETLLFRNSELTEKMSPDVINFVKNDGHVVYNQWVLYDGDTTDDMDRKAKSWQHKTGATTVSEAIRVLVDYGFNESGISFDDEGTMFLENNHTNFFNDKGKELWLNSITLRSAGRPNGEPLPFRLHQLNEIANWQSSYAFKLRKGDLLVLDNLRVGHGRLPYRNSAGVERKLLTCYA